MQRFKKAHKGARKSWNIPDSFPNHVVIAEYMSPTVDTARDRWVLPAAMFVCHSPDTTSGRESNKTAACHDEGRSFDLGRCI